MKHRRGEENRRQTVSKHIRNSTSGTTRMQEQKNQDSLTTKQKVSWDSS